MKSSTRKVYTCETCGYTSTSKGDVSHCEELHYELLDCTVTFSRQSRWPDGATVKYGDGKHRWERHLGNARPSEAFVEDGVWNELRKHERARRRTHAIYITVISVLVTLIGLYFIGPPVDGCDNGRPKTPLVDERGVQIDD